MTLAQAPRAARRVTQWYRDPLSCLQTTIATLLVEAGHDPLEVLGLSWEFRYHAGDVRPEEYYWPCAVEGDLVGSLLPHHDAGSRWRPLDPAFGDLADAVAEGRLPIVAVDNFHLPFRPAYQDVHAAHLVVVYDVDRVAGRVGVSDAQPPSFRGYLDLDVLARSCAAANIADVQDVFFSGSGLGGRWLDVRLPGEVPRLDRQRLRQALTLNAHLLRAPRLEPSDRWTGLGGLRGYLELLTTSAEAADDRSLVEAYTFGWAMQAQSALHGELLRTLGARWQLPELAEAGRRVEQVAHRWTAVRLTAAHARANPADWSANIGLTTTHLEASYRDALAALDLAVTRL